MATTSLQDRITITELAEAGYTDAQIADQLGWSLATVRKWRRRGQRQGRPGLVSQMGRPAKGALSAFPLVVRETLRAWRLAHPGWGPLTLLTELAEDERFKDKPLPGCSSIARWLDEQEFTGAYQKHQELPQGAASPAQACHQAWEMDAKGQQYVPEAGMIALIDVNDVFSKVKVSSYPCWVGQQRTIRHPNTPDYQLVLRLAFSEWGLPDRLAVDHDSVFYDNTSKSPFPTRFHLWLLALGVPLTFGRMGRATDQATTERSHQLWEKQVLLGQHFPTWESLYTALKDRQTFLNERLPCAPLGQVPPLIAHPEARIPRRLYRPEWEAELLDLARVYHYLSQGRWFRTASAVGTVKLGGQVYGLGRKWHHCQVEISFDPAKQQLIFHAPNGQTISHLPLLGITVTDLMGEMAPLVGLNNFQLALPFSWDEWRVVRLCEILP